MKQFPDISDVWAASKNISSLVSRTPVLQSPELEEVSQAKSVHLKLDLLQPTGSFKVRGAVNKVLSLSQEQKRRGVITFSTGNHGRAVAYAAKQAGVRAVVCLSKRVPAYRAEAVRELGGEVEIYGNSQDEAEQRYFEILEQEKLVPIAPFDDPHIIAGQGTSALEILQQVQNIDVLLVPLSGGGLLSGMAMTVKSLNPSVKVIGISARNTPVMLESLRAGHAVVLEEKETIADSLSGGIGKNNQYTFRMVRDFADDHIVVDEQDISRGMHWCFSRHGLAAEGAAAVGIGAVLSRKADIRGRHAVIQITGRNVEISKYVSVLIEEGKQHG